MRSVIRSRYPNALELLAEMNQWMAYGYFEGIDLPWPRNIGMAYRRYYENRHAQLPSDRLLVPCGPACYAPTYVNFHHSSGMVSQLNEKGWIEAFPQHEEFIRDVCTELEVNIPALGGYTHSNPDIERILAEGVDGMEQELDEQLATVQAQGENANPQELNLLLSLKDYVTGIRAFHSNLLNAVEEKTREAGVNPELMIIAKHFKHCLLRPATNFIQALLSANLAWVLDGYDNIGRLDQTLGAFWESDIASGALDLTFGRKLIDDLFQSFNIIDGCGWNLQIGGVKPDGSEGYNALTHEIILACRRCHKIRPNVAFRVSGNTPDEALMEAVKTLAEGSGRPALYNDDLYVKKLLEIAPNLGLTPEDARDYGFGGCTETMFPGKSNIGSTEGAINLAQAMELALHDGFEQKSNRQVGIHTGKFENFSTFEEFNNAVKKQIEFLQRERSITLYRDHVRKFTEGDPKLYRTFFTRDCVKNRKSFEAGGARYNGSCVIYQGVANLIDSLAAVKKCVFDDKSVKAADLIAALKNNFVGFETVHRQVSAAPKYGNDIPYVDDIGQEIMGFAFADLYAQPHARNGRYLPHSAVFYTYGYQGLYVSALPDGRKAFTVLSDSTGPGQGRDISGPTAMLKSVTKLPLSEAIGTMVVNIRLSKDMLSTDKGVETCVRLIRTYFALGGMQLQISVVSKEAMLAAQAKPEEHKDLIVRIGGFSVYFVGLDKKMQDSVIARTEHSLT